MSSSEVYNPYLPGWEYVPDAEPRVFGERLYVFGSHDQARGNGYCPGDYVAWSAPVDDLSAWHYEGVIYRKADDPRKNATLYAPDVVRGADGAYYLFYSVANSSVISVAFCDEPAGRYCYLGDVHRADGQMLGKKSSDPFGFDPAVLVDDDGRIWLYMGSGQDTNKRYGHPLGLFVAELMPDMLTLAAEPALLMEPDWDNTQPNFWEGPSIRHIGDLYYLVYPTTDLAGLGYATSRHPNKGFVYRGPIHSASNACMDGRTAREATYPLGNSHGGIMRVAEQWYVFNHRMTNGTLFSRQGVAESICIADDGTIAPVEATSCGLNGGPLSGRGVYPAHIACELYAGKAYDYLHPLDSPYVTQDEPDYDPDRGESPQPLPYVCNVGDGAVVGYRYFALDGARTLRLTACGTARGTICVGDAPGEGALTQVNFDANSWEPLDVACALVGKRVPVFLQFHIEGTLSIRTIEFVS